MTTKTVDDHGRLTLGPNFAGQTVIVDDSDPERIVITRPKSDQLVEDEEAEWAELERRALPGPNSGWFSSCFARSKMRSIIPRA